MGSGNERRCGELDRVSRRSIDRDLLEMIGIVSRLKDRMTKETALKEFIPQPGIGVMRALTEKEYDTSQIKMVVLSHRHFDRK